MSFEGLAELSLDAKGRLTLPARYRDVLSAAGDLVVTAHPDRCLLLYTSDAWAPIAARVRQLSDGDPRVRQWKRLLIGHVDRQQMDNAGRILVRPELRKYANLDKQVMLTGLTSHFEIWDLATWDKSYTEMDALRQAGLPPGLEDLAL